MSTDRLCTRRDVPFELVEFNLSDATDDELMDLSRESGTGLSLDEMHRVRKYFEEKGRNPTRCNPWARLGASIAATRARRSS